MKIGVNTMNVSAAATVSLAQTAERLGFSSFGTVDTAPLLYQAMYPTVTASLLATERIRIGPHVTNPISQHWSVHGSSARTLEELAPGRFVLGIGSGDGAIHSVGLRSMKMREFEAALVAVKEMLPPAVPLQVAASGPRAIECGGRNADELVIGVGLDLGSIGDLAARARSARREAETEGPLEIWASVPFWAVERDDELEAVRSIARGNAFSLARLNLSAEASYEGKNVPDDWAPILRERFARYRFSTHAVVGEENPNTLLFRDLPEIEEYLINRFSLVGTPAQCAARIGELERAGVDGITLNLLSFPDADFHSQLELAAAAVGAGAAHG